MSKEHGGSAMPKESRKQEIQKIEERAKAATKGPFVLPSYGDGTVAVITKAGGLTRNVVADRVLLADADFFAHACKDIVRLLGELKAVELWKERNENDGEWPDFADWVGLDNIFDPPERQG